MSDPAGAGRMEGFLSNRICVAITNYDFSENADRLYDAFSALLPTVMFDSSSPSPPSRPHVSIPNTYYPGLWDAAVGHALEHGFEWLMFVASDVEIGPVARLCANMVEAISIEELGIYTPSVTYSSRCSFKLMFTSNASAIRECGLSEGFIFLARTEILRPQYPLRPKRTFGWGVDVASCMEAYKQGKVVAVDDRIAVFHPAARPEHAIDHDAATADLVAVRPPETDAWMAKVQGRLATRFRFLNRTSSLDLGCGPNPQNKFRATEVYGVDIRDLPDPNIRRADLNIEPIPFADNSFDYVTASDFIEHVARMLYAPGLRFPFIELMNEVYRVLRSSGVFLSVTPAYPDGKAFQDPTHVNFITESTLPDYFCTPKLWASMYGFNGRFDLLRQTWDDGKLVTFMRANKD